MNAQEARELTKKHVNTLLTQCVQRAIADIKEAASHGHTKVLLTTSSLVWRELAKWLEFSGYHVEATGPALTVSW